MTVDVFCGASSCGNDVAAVAYTVVDTDSGALLHSGIRPAKPNRKTIDLQAVKAAVMGLAYIYNVAQAVVYTHSCTALSILAGTTPAPKGTGRLASDIRRRMAVLPFPVSIRLSFATEQSISNQLADASLRGGYQPPTAQQYDLLRGK